MATIVRTCEPLECVNEIWEDAYSRFETPEQEIEKFRRRLVAAGARSWPADSQIVEIFCGRGNSLVALSQLGFRKLQGADLSERLLRQFSGEATLYVADCRRLPFEDCSQDIVVVQGGLHHLPALPEDLVSTLDEVRRILRPNGKFVAIEPWTTPFLNFVHFICLRTPFPRCYAKLRHLSTMIDEERETYFKWLGMPKPILTLLDSRFRAATKRIAYGKLEYVGVRD
jgi:SAM-dependent methyltransferase